MSNNVVIFGLPGADQLTNKICDVLQIQRSQITIKKFADEEIFCRPLVSVRNKKVILIQSTAAPVNDNIMTLLIAIDALKRASAREINVIIPYFSYARQDRKSQGREPISAKLVADLISTAGATRVMIVDLHSDQIQGFFNIPVDTIRAIYILVCALFEEYDCNDLCVVSPDYGGVKRARKISLLFNASLAIIDKRRPEPGQVQIENILGDVSKKNCILVDDMIDTGNTMVESAKILKQKGAKRVVILATHALFNGNAVANFNMAHEKQIIDRVFITDSIQSPLHDQIKCLKKISIAKFLSDLIKIYIDDEGSISEIYEKYQTTISTKIQQK